MTPRERQVESFAAIHAVHLAELVARWGITAPALFDAAGLDARALSHPGERISAPAFVALVERARTLTGEPGLGIYLGLQMRATWHGYLGLAVMTSANVGQALELAVQFLPTQTSALSFDLEVDGAQGSLFIRERTDLGPARDAIVLALMVGIWKLGGALTGQPLGGAAEVAFAEPAYVARFAGVIPSGLRFSQAEHRLRFPAGSLQVPFTSADPAMLRLTREQCERELHALGFAGPFRDRVRALALRPGGGVRSVDEVAAQLHVSARTLKRRLTELHTTYSELLDAERARASLSLLRGPAPLDAIADHLGYSDVANFSRAFKRWTGKPPGAARKRGAKAR